MKKPKLDVAGIKNWLLAHGEKVAFGICTLLFLMFVYSALKLESLEDTYEPAKMETLASTVQQHVTSSKWDAKRENIQVVNYAERAKPKPLAVGTFVTPIPLNPRDTDPKSKRGKPEILPVEELRVAAGMDLFALKAASGGTGGDATIRAQPWAVVTGLVPIAKQRLAYAGAFAEAMEYVPARDVPTYLKPVLERAVVDPAKPDQLNWEAVPDASAFIATWSVPNSEIVAAKYVDPELTAPLGDLIGKEWDEAISHPKIPLDAVANSSAPAGAAPGARPAGGAAGAPAGATPISPVSTRDASAAGANNTTTASTATGAETEEVQYQLFRAFDYSVQPGKRYRYRVTLVLNNPNSTSLPQHLQDPESAKAPTLASAVSPATALVTIPDGHDVLAGAIVSPGTKYSEPIAKIVVTAIHAASGLKPGTELDVRRGSLADTPPRKVKARNPIDKSVTELEVGFDSNILVLDIYGGKELSRKKHDPPITTPGELLLFDANGNMTVRSELDDAAQYNESLVRDEPKEKPKALDEKEADAPKTIRSRGKKQ
jgi:hypothetical protein